MDKRTSTFNLQMSTVEKLIKHVLHANINECWKAEVAWDDAARSLMTKMEANILSGVSERYVEELHQDSMELRDILEFNAGSLSKDDYLDALRSLPKINEYSEAVWGTKLDSLEICQLETLYDVLSYRMDAIVKQLPADLAYCELVNRFGYSYVQQQLQAALHFEISIPHSTLALVRALHSAEDIVDTLRDCKGNPLIKGSDVHLLWALVIFYFDAPCKEEKGQEGEMLPGFVFSVHRWWTKEWALAPEHIKLISELKSLFKYTVSGRDYESWENFMNKATSCTTEVPDPFYVFKH
jgi:hypothetical protein